MSTATPSKTQTPATRDMVSHRSRVRSLTKKLAIAFILLIVGETMIPMPPIASTLLVFACLFLTIGIVGSLVAGTMKHVLRR